MGTVVVRKKLRGVDRVVQFGFADDQDVWIHSVTKCGDLAVLSFITVGVQNSNSNIITRGQNRWLADEACDRLETDAEDRIFEGSCGELGLLCAWGSNTETGEQTLCRKTESWPGMPVRGSKLLLTFKL